MRFASLFLIASALFAGPQTGPRPVSNTANVNSRYDVEGIEVTGVGEYSLTKKLHDEIQQLVGSKLDPELIARLGDRIRTELRAKSVTHRIVRGDLPDHVRVVFEVSRRRVDFDISVPRFLYHSRQGWTGEFEAALTYEGNTLAFGLVSDADQLPERNSGIYARYENRRLGSDRVRAGVRFESYRQQWNAPTPETLALLPGVPGIYRTRQNVQPTVTILLARTLVLETGLSFQHIETQFPAARTEAVHAVVNTLRYHREWEGSNAKQVLDAGYSLRAATRSLSSDFGYARHRIHGGYTVGKGNQALTVGFLGGLIAGDAPLFDRFVLGNSTTLRGWNKFDIAPTGGNRAAHGSVEYRVRFLQVFYDTGCVWDRDQDRSVRHSAGIGLRKGNFSVAMAFPLREGRADPILMAGMNF